MNTIFGPGLPTKGEARGDMASYFLKLNFGRNIFLKIHFCVILQGIQNIFGPGTPRISSAAGLRMSLYVFWLRKGPSIKYVRNCLEDGLSSKMCKAAYRGRGCHALCVRTHLHYLLSCFWQHFYLIVFRFICRNLTLPFFKKDMFITNGYFSLTRLICVIMK